MKQFWRRTEELEDECITFLDTKFTRLRSALGAFEMLKDFTTTASRPRINVKLGEKFVDILKHFSMCCSKYASAWALSAVLYGADVVSMPEDMRNMLSARH